MNKKTEEKLGTVIGFLAFPLLLGSIVGIPYIFKNGFLWYLLVGPVAFLGAGIMIALGYLAYSFICEKTGFSIEIPKKIRDMEFYIIAGSLAVISYFLYLPAFGMFIACFIIVLLLDWAHRSEEQ